MAAQLTLIKGRSRRGLKLWIARAISSFPVPVSPKMRTVEPLGATTLICLHKARIAALRPMIPSKSSPEDSSSPGISASPCGSLEFRVALMRRAFSGSLATFAIPRWINLKIKTAERFPTGAGQSENTNPAIREHQRDGAKVIDAPFQQPPGKIRETGFLLGRDDQRTLMLPNPIRNRIIQGKFRFRAKFRREAVH